MFFRWEPAPILVCVADLTEDLDYVSKKCTSMTRVPYYKYSLHFPLLSFTKQRGWTPKSKPRIFLSRTKDDGAFVQLGDQTPAASTRRLQPAPRSPTDRRGATNTKDEALLLRMRQLGSNSSSEAPGGSATRRATGAALADPSGLLGQAHNYEAARGPSH